LVHHAEIIAIEGPSYRLKEAKKREVKRKNARKKRNSKTAPKTNRRSSP